MSKIIVAIAVIILSLNANMGRADITQQTTADPSCSNFLKDLGRGFRTGYVSVPEDWDNPGSSKTIRVFFYWRPEVTRGVGPSPQIPVVFFNGGPGGDSHAS